MVIKNIKFYGVVTVLVLSGCFTPRIPLYTKPVQNNKDYVISYLFEHDGCKVYRFVDMGEYVYFTSCNGETSYRADSTTVIRNRIRKE
jgi:hypothetical protein